MISALASLVLCASAQAGIVTVGSTSTTPAGSSTIGGPASLFNTALGGAGANVTSPVTGTIIRWHVTGFTGGPFRLRVLTPLGGQSYLGGGSSGPATPLSTATETFAASLPINAGQTIAVDNTNPSDKIGIVGVPTSSYSFLLPPLANGATGTAAPPAAGAEFTFNAEVLLLPAVSVISPTTGSVKGGTVVQIAGHDFTEVSAVKFGAVPATLYSVESEGLIKAVAPPSAAPGPVDVTVTTPAGTTPVGAGSLFTYTACVVPKLAGKKLKGAKKRIRKAGCKVGTVKKLEGATAKTGVVVKQNPKAGKILAPGTKVSVKLGT